MQVFNLPVIDKLAKLKGQGTVVRLILLESEMQCINIIGLFLGHVGPSPKS